MVAAGMTGKPITITGMNKNSVQADRRIMQVMIDAGCDVVWDGMNVTVTGQRFQADSCRPRANAGYVACYGSPRFSIGLVKAPLLRVLAYV